MLGLSNQIDSSPITTMIAIAIEIPWCVQKAKRLLFALQVFRCASQRKNLPASRMSMTKTSENRSFRRLSTLTPISLYAKQLNNLMWSDQLKNVTHSALQTVLHTLDAVCSCSVANLPPLFFGAARCESTAGRV